LTIDGSIKVNQRAVEILDRRIAALEARLADEEAAEWAGRRQQAIKTVEAMMPARTQIVAEIEAAVKAIPGLFEKLSAWKAKFIKQYPPDLEFPYAHFIDSDRLLRNVQAALRNPLGEDVHEVIDGLAASEAEQHADLIADLKARSPAKSDEEGIAA